MRSVSRTTALGSLVVVMGLVLARPASAQEERRSMCDARVARVHGAGCAIAPSGDTGLFFCEEKHFESHSICRASEDWCDGTGGPTPGPCGLSRGYELSAHLAAKLKDSLGADTAPVNDFLQLITSGMTLTEPHNSIPIGDMKGLESKEGKLVLAFHATATLDEMTQSLTVTMESIPHPDLAKEPTFESATLELMVRGESGHLVLTAKDGMKTFDW
jgi:hypothetical protein